MYVFGSVGWYDKSTENVAEEYLIPYPIFLLLFSSMKL